MCAVYGNSKKPENVEGCINGINNRTLVCQPGYHIKTYEHDHKPTDIPPPFKSQLLITGYDAFYGCFPYCGDGVVTTGEECDDGNDLSGDGCFECKVEPSYNCQTQGEQCCFAGDFYDVLVGNLNLVCVDGWWMHVDLSDNSKRSTTDDLTITIDGLDDFIMNSDYLRLCGPVVIQNQNFAVTGSATLHVAGPIYVEKDGVLSLSTDLTSDDSRIYLSEPCSGWLSLVDGVDENEAGLHVNTDGTIHVIQDSAVVVNTERDIAQTPLIPLISAYGCVRIRGIFSYEADSIPQEDNYYPLTNSTNWIDCIFDVETEDVVTTLPSCPIILLELQDNWVVVVTATHRMCAGGIGGVVVGTTAAIGAAAAAAALLLGAPASAATADYVTL